MAGHQIATRVRRAASALALAPALLAPAGAWAETKVVPEGRAQIQFSFAPLVKRTAPAVVNIYTRRTVRALPSPLLSDPFFRRLFGDQFPGARERVQNSLGSGVIVDPAGLIVTNHHVIRGADEITVVLADRREFEATVLRTDERTDLAVLRIDASAGRLPALELSDSDELEVGDLVMAIGNPFGVGQTVTTGIVSALARTMVGVSDYRFFIQTDAAINPGNSGGALVSMDGKLVGINTAIFSRDGGSNGVSFAIPSNMVQSVIAGVASGGKLVRPWLGASGQTVTAELAASLGLPRPIGVIVKDLHPGSPAERAGLQRGDVITRVDGREVDDSEALRFRIATHKVGSTVNLTVWRKGHERALSAALIAPPETPARDSTALRGNHPLAGATVANLSPLLAEELGLESAANGVIVTEIARGSPAHAIRLAPGDILVRLNDRDLRGVDELRRIVAQAAQPWRIVLKRGERVVNLTVGG
ncbi:MAG: DegQ family serine endoprotease [Pseudomonadota bacterium]